MQVNFGDIAAGIVAAATLGSIIVWWVSRILDLRKDIIQLQMKQQFKDQEIEEIKKDIRELQEQWNRVT